MKVSEYLSKLIIEGVNSKYLLLRLYVELVLIEIRGGKILFTNLYTGKELKSSQVDEVLNIDFEALYKNVDIMEVK